MPLDGIQAEQLAYWYFRLNGYFTIKGFVVHPDIGIGQQTEIDIFGVRFPHRSELLIDVMIDDDIIIDDDKIQVVIVEVKAGLCKINKTWRDKTSQNIERFLRAVGILGSEEIEKAAQKLYTNGIFENDSFNIEIILVGKHFNSGLEKQYPLITQVLFEDILKFIYNRFDKYRLQKSYHDQWDDFGKELWRNYVASQNEEGFIQKYLDSEAT